MKCLFNLAWRSTTKNKSKSLIIGVGVVIATFLMSVVIILFSSYNDSVLASYVKNNGNWHIVTSSHFLYKNLPLEDISGVVSYGNYGYSQIENNVDELRPYIHITARYIVGEANKPIDLKDGRTPGAMGEIVVSDAYAKDYNVKVGDDLVLDIGYRISKSSNEHLWQNASYSGPENEYISYEKTDKYKVVGIFIPTSEFEYVNMSPGYACVAYGDKIYDRSNIYISFHNPSDGLKYVDGIETHASKLIQTDVTNIFEESEQSILLVAVLVLMLIIFVVSTVFILNNYVLNYEERMRDNAVLTSLGTTKRQLFLIAMLENLFIAVIAVPIGIVLAFLALLVSFDGITGLINNMVYDKLDLQLKFDFALVVLIFAIGLVMSILSSLIAFSLFNKKNTMLSLRQNDTIRNKKIKCRLKFKKVENELIYLNFMRKKSMNKAVIVSIIMSLVLFLSADVFFDGAIKYIKGAGGLYYQISVSSEERSDNVSVYNKLLDIDGVNEGMWRSRGELGDYKINLNDLTPEMANEFKERESCSIIYNVIDDISYDKLINIYGGVPDNNGALAYARFDIYSSDGAATAQEMFKEDKLEINITKDGENNHENTKIDKLQLQFIRKAMPIELESIGLFIGINVFLREADIGRIFHSPPCNYTFYYSAGDYIGAVSGMEALAKENNWDIRVENLMSADDKSAYTFSIIEVFVKTFTALIMAVSIINLISSIVTNIAKRKTELAVLCSLGMEEKTVSRMLFKEIQLIFAFAVIISAVSVIAISIVIQAVFGFNTIKIPIAELLILCAVYEVMISISAVLALKSTLKGDIIANIRNMRY